MRMKSLPGIATAVLGAGHLAGWRGKSAGRIAVSNARSMGLGVFGASAQRVCPECSHRRELYTIVCAIRGPVRAAPMFTDRACDNSARLHRLLAQDGHAP